MPSRMGGCPRAGGADSGLGGDVVPFTRRASTEVCGGEISEAENGGAENRVALMTGLVGWFAWEAVA